MKIVDIKVWGEYACFTRPEFKVERVSYPVITPSAARGILEAIYWKPQIRYKIQRIGVLESGTHWSLLRNEISKRQSNRSPRVVVDESRQQRTSLILKNVAYRIQGRIELRNGETNIAKHLDCFRRRVERGQYFHKPFLGCREFAADFEWLGGGRNTGKTILPDASLNLPVGTMLYDTAYIVDPEHYKAHPEDRLTFYRQVNGISKEQKGYAKRLFFNAEIKEGWLVEQEKDCLPQSLFNKLTELEV